MTPLQHATAGGVATLTLARPDRGNALGAELVEALIQHTQAVLADAQVHSLVLRAEGPHFCTGLDLSDLDSASDGDLLHRLVRIETLLQLWWHAPVRTVAVAQGRCWGAGADLFAVCEQRVAAPGTSFRFPGAQFGIVLGTRRLAERLGADRVRAITTQGLQLDDAPARACGLVNADVEDLSEPRVGRATAAALRAATRADHRDADLAALVRSAAEPGLRQRIADYRVRQLAAKPPK
jgi:enoyl-CoA hydratase/carnithine racemase